MDERYNECNLHPLTTEIITQPTQLQRDGKKSVSDQKYVLRTDSSNVT